MGKGGRGTARRFAVSLLSELGLSSSKHMGSHKRESLKILVCC